MKEMVFVSKCVRNNRNSCRRYKFDHGQKTCRYNKESKTGIPNVVNLGNDVIGDMLVNSPLKEELKCHIWKQSSFLNTD